MKVTMILKGRSFFKIVLSVLNEAKKAQIPTTIKPLKILEPIILLKAISLFPVNAARILTDASGALVPIATIVKPMITNYCHKAPSFSCGDIRQFFKLLSITYIIR